MANIKERFMGSTAHAFVFIVAVFFLIPTSSSAAESASTEYRHTIMTINNPAHQNMTSSIRRAVQQNDHTARIYLDSDHKTLFIIHHKSIGINELERFIAKTGISAKAIAQHNYQPQYKPVLLHNPDMLLKAGRNCGATKEAWKRLLQKYFH